MTIAADDLYPCVRLEAPLCPPASLSINRPLEHTAQFRRLDDVSERELTHDIAAARQHRSNPSCSSAATAGRNGVRETPSAPRAAAHSSGRHGANSPLRISSRKPSSARIL